MPEKGHLELWNDMRVVVARRADLLDYPADTAAPFDPGVRYPEYAGPVAVAPNPGVRPGAAGLAAARL